MPFTIQPASLQNFIDGVERRLSALERTSGVGDSVVVHDAQAPPVTRVGIGRLDALFPSAGYPAQSYGLRVQDASGNALLDSVGLQQVMKSIASNNIAEPGTTLPFTTTTTNFLDASFTLSRARRTLISSWSSSRRAT